MTSTAKLHPNPAAAFVRSIPVQFFWPAPRAVAVCVVAIITTKAAAQ